MEDQKDKKIKKEFRLSSLSVDNKSTVFVIIAILLLMGIGSYTSMPKESFPEVVMSHIYVGTPYPGNSPVDVENLITRPIEKELNTISEIDKIKSTSIQDYSVIIAEFAGDVEVEEALRKVKDAVDKSKSELPNDLDQEPDIFELDMSEQPIMNINLSGDYSMDALRKYAETLEDKIEKLESVSKVNIRGVMDREVKIDVDVHKMAALEISFNDIAGAIANENTTMGGGNVLSGKFRRSISVIGEFESIEEIENVVVKHEAGNIVYLRDIAEVTFDFEEAESYARQNGKPVVMLDVIKKSGENLLIGSDQINEILDEAKSSFLPKGLTVEITGDQSDMTRQMVSELENSIIFGVILVVLVLLFFLGLRNALFVGVAIPLSMFMAFMILGAMGVTLNIMVLFSLILALGMLVDNGIVVVENIYRLMDQGYSPLRAAKEGVGEVAWPIIASTATTLAAFLPLALWPGLMGKFMKYLPITLMIVLGSSLFVALVINPVLTALWMRVGAPKSMAAKRLWITFAVFVGLGLLFVMGGALSFGNLLIIIGIVIVLNALVLSPITKFFQNKGLPKLENWYERRLRAALKRPGLSLLGIVFLLFFSFVLLGIIPPKILFFPEGQPHYVNIFIEKPIGTDITETDKFTKQIEEIVFAEMKKPALLPSGDTVKTKDGKVLTYNDFLVESVIAQVGEGTSDPTEGPQMGVTPHKARVTVYFEEYEDRKGVKTSEVMATFVGLLKGFPGVTITVDQDPAGPPQGKPINIEIIGDNYEKLIVIAEDVKRFINSQNIGGIQELKTDVEVGKPDLLVDIDRAAARRYGISTMQIAGELRTALFGREISRYKEGEDDYPIMLRLNEEMRNDDELLLNQRITFRDPTNGRIKQVPISSVATSRKSSSYGSIKRLNLDRIATVQSNIVEGFNPTEVVNNIKPRLEEYLKTYDLPDGYSVAFTGQQEEQAKEFAFLGTALGIAVSLILLIIVGQFNSVGTPGIIMASVLFSITGVLLGLVSFQMDFIIIMTMIGIISLAGVVVNNAIVLIDYTNLVRKRKKAELGLKEDERLSKEQLLESIVEGGKTRLRPVLLTAITTVLGLLPLATGMNINFSTLLSSYNPNIYFGGDNVMFWGPMSWTVIFGLLFATFLTLIILPVMYLIKDNMKNGLKRLVKRLSGSAKTA